MTILSVLGSSDELRVAPHSPGSAHMECQYVRGIHVIFNLQWLYRDVASCKLRPSVISLPSWCDRIDARKVLETQTGGTKQSTHHSLVCVPSASLRGPGARCCFPFLFLKAHLTDAYAMQRYLDTFQGYKSICKRSMMDTFQS